MNLTVKVSKANFRYFLVFIVIWVLVGLNTGNADSTQYVAMFNAATRGNFYYAERGFLYLCMLFGKVGASYQFFLSIYSLVALILISDFVKRNTEYPALALLLYGLFPFMFDAVQIRNLMVEAIFLFAIRYLSTFNVKNLIKYVLLIAIAATQHVIAVVYLVFLLVYLKNQKKIFIISIVGSIVFVVLYKTFLGGFLSMVTSNRMNYAFAERASALSTVIKYTLFFGAYIAVGLYACKKKKALYHLSPSAEKDDSKNSNGAFWTKVILASICLVPVIIADGDYTRLFRNCLLIVYCVVLDREVYSRNRDYIFVMCILIALACIGCVLNFAPWVYYYDTVTYPILHNNMIFDWFKGTL